MAKAPRLKVYAATMGFYETVVAAPNQTAALKAWGVRRNLLADDTAVVVDDDAVAAAALAQPGVVLRRAIGSNDAYTADAPAKLDVPKRPASAARGKGPAKKPQPPKPPADRTARNTAERAVEALAAEHRRETAAIDRRRAELEAEATAAGRAFAARDKGLAREVERARAAFRKAGGSA